MNTQETVDIPLQSCCLECQGLICGSTSTASVSLTLARVSVSSLLRIAVTENDRYHQTERFLLREISESDHSQLSFNLSVA